MTATSSDLVVALTFGGNSIPSGLLPYSSVQLNSSYLFRLPVGRVVIVNVVQQQMLDESKIPVVDKNGSPLMENKIPFAGYVLYEGPALQEGQATPEEEPF